MFTELSIHGQVLVIAVNIYCFLLKLLPFIQSGCITVLDPTGHVILSAGRNGLIAVCSPMNGATVRVIRDHKGAQITTIQCVNEQVSLRSDQTLK